MAFATSTTFNRFCQNTVPSRSAAITAAAFGPLAALGQVPLTGIVGTFSKYSVLNNGVLVASNQTASSYTFTGLGNNVQIGPITVVPYNAAGTAGTAFVVTGGSGAGKIYTWAQANTPTFSATTSSGTTIACTGTFSKAYVTFSGGAGTPASGTLINTANSISQAYTGMAATTYTFTVYPVNGDGIPASASGTNNSSATITIPIITAAAFDTLTTFGQIPLSGITGSFATYSVFNNGVLVASGLTASTYTFTGLGNNVQIGPVTVVPYNASGTAGTAFVVTGGSGSGRNYTWAQANAPTFSAITSSGTTLACTGTFSSAYVTFSGGTGSPASGTLITGTNSITQIYTGMAGGTLYNFNVYPVNGGGIPASATGTNVVTGSVTTLPPSLWVAGGLGNTGNTFAYSTDGTTWTGLGKPAISTSVLGVAYSENQSRWVAVGSGGSTLAYSTNGTTWTGLTSIFSTQGSGVAYSANQDRWVAVGSGTNSFAYSTNGTTWTGLGKLAFSTQGYGVAYSAFQDRWIAVGSGTNSFAYSTNGTTWTGLGTLAFSTNGYGIAYSESQRRWVACGYGTNSFAYSTNGTTWTGFGISIFSGNGFGVAYSENQSRWVVTGNGSGGSTLAYSTNGTTWTGLGRLVFDSYGYGVAYSASQSRWIAGGSGTGNTLAYSTNGTTWTGLGRNVLLTGQCIAVNM